MRSAVAITIGLSLVACKGKKHTPSATSGEHIEKLAEATSPPVQALEAKEFGTGQKEEYFEHLVVASNGKSAVAFSRETALRFDIASGTVAATHSKDAIESAALSPDGVLAVISGETLAIGDKPFAMPKNRTPKRIVYAADGRAIVLAIASTKDSAGEQRALVIDKDKVVQDTVLTHFIPSEDDCDISISARGDLALLTACGDVKAYRVKDGAWLRAWSMSGENLVVGEAAPGAFAFAWQTGSDEPKTMLWTPGKSRGEEIDALGVCAFSSDARLLACMTDDDKTVVIRDTATRAARAKISLPASLDHLAFASDGRTLIGSLHDGRFVTADTSATLAAVPAVTLSAESRAVALDASKPIAADVPAKPLKASRMLQASWRPSSLVVSPDQKKVLLTVTEGVEMLDVTSGKRSDVFMEEIGAVRAPGIAWSPDSASLVEADDEKDHLRMFTLGSEESQSLGTSKGNAVAWSSKGVIAANAEDYGKIMLRDTSGAIRTLTAPEQSRQNGFAFSPDGGQLLSWGDSTLVWNVQAGTVTKALAGQTGSIESAAWSPDGTKLATFSDDHTVIVWDAASLAPIAAITTPSIGALAFSPDSKRLAIGAASHFSDNSEMSIWSLPGAKPIARYQFADDAAHVDLIAWTPDGILVAPGDINVWLLASP